MPLAKYIVYTSLGRTETWSNRIFTPLFLEVLNGTSASVSGCGRFMVNEVEIIDEDILEIE